jgi:glycosidase
MSVGKGISPSFFRGGKYMKRMMVILIAVFLLSSLPANAAVKKETRQWQDETVYSIMVDRFNNGNTKNDVDVNTQDPLAYNGGDFQGIIDKLDYIKDMGFTTIRLTSIFDNTTGGYHGYWVNDFYKTDEHFGSLKTFQKLVQEAHNRELKVIIDFVSNNVSAEHPWLKDTTKQNWFHEKQDSNDGNNQQEIENGWVNGLPDLDQGNPEVTKYLIDAAIWWINKTDIDGYSLPEVNHVPVSFWGDFSKEVKKEKENFLLMGVMSNNQPNDLAKYENAGIDSFFDYPHSENLRNVFEKTNQSFTTLYSDTERDKTGISSSDLMVNFFDNENTTRFTSDIVENKHFPGSRWKTALTYLYSTPGIPVVFYGSEIALNGGEIPDNHRQMNFRTEKELIDFITKLGELRNQLPSLSRGTMEMLYDRNGMAVYKRVYQGETVIIAINNTSESQNVTLTAEQLEGGKELRGLLMGDLVRSKDNQYSLIIDRDEAEIYVLAEKSGINLPLVGSIAAVYLLVMIFLFLIWKKGKKNDRA